MLHIKNDRKVGKIQICEPPRSLPSLRVLAIPGEYLFYYGGSKKDGGRAARHSSQDTGGSEYVDYLSEQPDHVRSILANMDIQYVMNAYACVMNVASYIMKTERAMGVLLKQVATEARTEELRSQLKKVGSAFLTHREVSAQEAVYSIPTVVYFDTNPKQDRIAVSKDNTALSQLSDDDTNVFQKSLIDRYQHRPKQLI